MTLKGLFDSAEFNRAVSGAVDLAEDDIHDRWCQEVGEIEDPRWTDEEREAVLAEFIDRAETMLATRLGFVE